MPTFWHCHPRSLRWRAQTRLDATRSLTEAEWPHLLQVTGKRDKERDVPLPSTHWMRHTFVRQALVDGAPLEVASELAGHASIATTSIYSSQELARKIEAIRGTKRPVVAG